ncbi:MAG: hypothetical protein ABH850_00720 [Candidatus Micrarchaeota archaeon]
MDYEKPSVKKLNIKFAHITGTAIAKTTPTVDSSQIVVPDASLA